MQVLEVKQNIIDIGGITMDIVQILMVTSQLTVQIAASIAVIKKATGTVRENATQITEMIKNFLVDLNIDNHIDVSI